MRKFVRMVGLVAGLSGLAVQAAGAETLADALVAAYRNSHLLDQNQAVLRATDEDAAAAMAALRPAVDFAARANRTRAEGGVTSDWSSSMDVTASIVIWAGGRGRLALDVARESVLATRQALVSVEQDVLLDAVSAYVTLGLQQEIVALRESNVRVITRELRAARDRFEVGEITQTDVAQAEAALAAAQAELAAARGALLVASETYKAAIGHAPSGLAALPRAPALPASMEEAKVVAKRSHPSVIRAQHSLKASDLAVQIAKAAFGPSVSGSLSAGQDLNSGEADVALGLSFSQSIYAGGETSSNYRAALANKDASAASLLQTGVTVELAVGQAWSNLAVANASIQASTQQIAAAQRAFDGVREEATLGARTTLDVLTAEQDLLTARAARLESEADRYVGVYTVLSTMGLLTAEHLKLGVPTYDPNAYYDAVKNAPATTSRGKALDRIMQKIGN